MRHSHYQREPRPCTNTARPGVHTVSESCAGPGITQTVSRPTVLSCRFNLRTQQRLRRNRNTLVCSKSLDNASHQRASDASAGKCAQVDRQLHSCAAERPSLSPSAARQCASIEERDRGHGQCTGTTTVVSLAQWSIATSHWGLALASPVALSTNRQTLGLCLCVSRTVTCSSLLATLTVTPECEPHRVLPLSGAHSGHGLAECALPQAVRCLVEF